MVSELTKIYKQPLRLMILSWIILIVYLILFMLGIIQSIDEPIYQLISAFHSQALTYIVKFITWFGSTMAVIVICLIIFIINQKIGVWISIHVSLIALLNQLIKLVVARERPSVLRLIVETGYSFPSAHAMVSFALFGLITYYVYQKKSYLSLLIMMIPLLIGMTRIYLGVHYASDVIAGFLFSLTYLCTLNFMMTNHKKLPLS